MSEQIVISEETNSRLSIKGSRLCVRNSNSNTFQRFDR